MLPLKACRAFYKSPMTTHTLRKYRHKVFSSPVNVNGRHSTRLLFLACTLNKKQNILETVSAKKVNTSHHKKSGSRRVSQEDV